MRNRCLGTISFRIISFCIIGSDLAAETQKTDVEPKSSALVEKCYASSLCVSSFMLIVLIDGPSSRGLSNQKLRTTGVSPWVKAFL
jgi:hypothetical protein